MKDNLNMIDKISNELRRILEENKWDTSKISVVKNKNIEFGEFNTNIAFLLSKELDLNPMDLANEIVSKFDKNNLSYIKDIEVVKPGFINFHLNDKYYADIVKDVVQNKEYGKKTNNNTTINVEFVSANPTGFLHVAHARGAVFGDSLSNILDYAGYNVIREYYINDVGNQIDRLAISIYIRYHQELGVQLDMPEDSYIGIDIIWGAKEIIKKYGNKFLNVPFKECVDEIKKNSLEIMLSKIKSDLLELGVKFDIWFSEKTLYENNLIEKQLDTLKGIYEKDGAKWLETTKYGDDKDRVLVKADGVGTYFLSDTVYHNIKASREPKPQKLINVWGADHIGYIKRVETALLLQGYPSDILTVITMQLVRLIKDGKEMKMSKRKGTSLFMSELVEQVGKDTTRFFLINRTNNSTIDFDIDLANLKSNDNPVFSIQYANARIKNLIKNTNISYENNFNELKYDNTEHIIINLMDKFPQLIEEISQNYKIHLLAQYLIDLAKEYNSLYSNIKIIGSEKERELILLSIGCSNIFKIGLKLLGVSAPERM